MLNVFGPANILGVGTHCINFCSALERSGIEITLIPPFGSVSVENETTDRWLENRKSFNPKNPSLMIFDSQFLTQFCGNPRIGFVVTETDGIEPLQLAAIKSCDVVITPSKWGQKVLSLHGIDSLVVNEGYDPEEFRITPLNRTDETVKFCHVGKLEMRKGTMQVLDCFFTALENEDAHLEMHCENQFYRDWYNDINYWFQARGFTHYATGASGIPFWPTWRRAGLSIKLCPSQSENLATVYAGSDCGIFPSKGEGWGLPILECIATGVPAIVGNWTGQSEYLGDSYPKELTLEKFHSETASDGIWYHGNKGNWNVPENDELIQKICWAHKNIRYFRVTNQWLCEIARIRTYTWDASVEQFRKHFTNIT